MLLKHRHDGELLLPRISAAPNLTAHSPVFCFEVLGSSRASQRLCSLQQLRPPTYCMSVVVGGFSDQGLGFEDYG